MIMEINVWLLIIVKNKSVKRPFSILKVSGLSRESLDVLAILNLYAFFVLISHIFVIDWYQLQKSIAKFKFLAKCLDFLYFC